MDSQAFEGAAKVTPTEIAKVLNVSPKALRRFMRSQTSERAGKGGAWSLDADTANELIARYNGRSVSRSTTFKLTNDDDDN